MTIRTLHITLKLDFEQLYKKLVTRPGSGTLMEYLTSSDFFTAPSSRAYHLGFAGGLFFHSCNVYECLQHYFKEHPDRYLYSEETLFICSMFHDLCKVNYYEKDNKVGEKPAYKVKDQFPFGHGEKSAYLLSKHIELLNHEALAIRWHMGMTDQGVHSYYPSGAAFQLSMKCPLVAALHIADMMAANREKKMSYYRNKEWYHVAEQEKFSVLDYKRD